MWQLDAFRVFVLLMLMLDDLHRRHWEALLLQYGMEPA